MWGYAARRLAQMPLVMLLVTLVLYLVMHQLPGDPIYAIIGPSGTTDPATIAALREKYRLDDPVPVQYARWLGDVARGDLGRSATTRVSVAGQIAKRIPATTQLALCAMVVALLIGIPAGVIAALKRGSSIDWLVTLVAMFGIAVPSFWLSMLLIWLFVVTLGWLPASGFTRLWDDPALAIRQMTLPALALGLTLSGSIMRYTRSSVLEVLGQDYVRTARAKGLHERRVVVAHALRNALLPVATVIGVQISHLLAGSVIVESMFAIPGLGRLAVESISGRDYPTLQGVVLLFTLIVLAVSLLTDMLYAVLDPRIKYG